MSDTTLSSIQSEIDAEIQKSQNQKNDQNNALKDRPQIVEDCLARARNYYAKKEWARAFAEWDRVCAFLTEEDGFRQKIALLKESHENLAKVNRELVDVKGILNQRSSPSAADRKFVQEAHEQTNGQIKNVYSYLSQQLRTERTPKTLSFWWPVLLSVILLGIVYGSFSAHDSKRLGEWKVERDDLLKKTENLKHDYENKIETLEQQNTGWRNARREKIDEMENQIRELGRKNEELSRRNEMLIQDNLDKDKPKF